MPFQAPAKQPNFAPLYTSLANSKAQKGDNALYQTIFFLIQQVTQSRDLFVQDINKINNTIAQILNATFLTANDESHLFFNSRQLIAGSGISFDDSTPHKRIISTGGGGGFPSTVAANGFIDFQPPHEVFENEIYTTLINSSFGTGGTSTGLTIPQMVGYISYRVL